MLALSVERVGPLPLINPFLERLALEAHLERFVPTPLPYAKGLGILLRSLRVEREPLYRQYETVSGRDPTQRLKCWPLGSALHRKRKLTGVYSALTHEFLSNRLI
jgi:hypothetical protein